MDRHDRLVGRREFVRIGLGAGGALAVGIIVPPRIPRGVANTNSNVALGAFIEIASNGVVRIVAKNPEIGTGVRTSLPMLVADELDVDWRAVHVVQADYAAAMYGDQFTGGSTGVSSNWTSLRTAGAAARQLLVSAAARRWGVPAAECSTSGGTVIHEPTRRSASYGSLASDAARLPAPRNVRLKTPREFRIIGTPTRVSDAMEIVTGRARYGIDQSVHGMLVACIAKGPFGATPLAVNDARALAVPGVVRVVRVDASASPTAQSSGVAVLAQSTWAAMLGRDALDVTWSEPAAHTSSAALEAAYRDALSKRGTVLRDDGDVDRALASSDRIVDATYELPFLAHVPMEPVHYLADVRGDRAELWGSTQDPEAVQQLVAKVTGIAPSRITVHLSRSGGGFGRRLMVDYAAEAAILSKAVGRPVKVMWTREDDVRHDYYRPAGHHRIRAGLSSSGAVTAWMQHLANSSRYAFAQNGQPPEASEMYRDDFPMQCLANARMEYTHVPASVPTGAWRSTLHSANAFAVESFIDELAHAAGVDPVTLRLDLLGAPRRVPYAGHGGPTFDTGRLSRVIQRAATESAWPQPAGNGQGWGFAAHFTFGSYVAVAARVAVEHGTIRVQRIVSVVDCGLVVNPLGAEAQVQGGTLDGLSAALFGEITVEGGAVVQRNFGDYRLLRLAQAPPVDVHFVRSDAPPSGLGEPPVPPVAPALANAIFAATGIRIRRLPLAPNLQTH